MITRKLDGAALVPALPKGTIDTQMHMYLAGFPAREGGPGLPPAPLPDAGAYRRVMRWLGIDRVVITQGNAHQNDNGNLLACLREMGDVARGVAVISGATPEAELARLDQAGVVGARIMDLPGGAQGLSALEAVDARAAEMGWMLAVQFDGNRLLDLEPRLKMLKSRWVLDHHGKFFAGAGADETSALKRLIDGGRMWYKFAGAYESSRRGGPDFADVAVYAREIAAHAPERIVWGTNWPHNAARTTDAYPCDKALCETALGWLPDLAARQRVLVDNPQELYGFAPIG
ncbi:amidohydrolase family protein [Thioclava sp. GXIMD4216]|uniref:amidohydrolase family protein n=1 Tax=Thioclava sp. GXIMD4216 TaxID=3131929 RepID=UPI0030CE3AAD